MEQTGGVDSAQSGGGEGKMDTRRTTVDVGHTTKMRENCQYGKLTSVGLPSRLTDTDASWTAADAGRTPKTRGRPQYDRQTSFAPTH